MELPVQREEPLASLDGVLRLLGRSNQTELLPLAVAAYAQHAVHVLLLVPFEVRTHVEPPAGECTPLGDAERQEQSTDVAVALDEGVNRLKLVVRQECPDQWVQWALLVEVLLEGFRRITEFERWWRYKAGGSADLVLHRPEVSRAFVVSAHALEKNCVQIANQPEGDREFPVGALQGVQCTPVVVNLAQGVRSNRRGLGRCRPSPSGLKIGDIVRVQ